MKKYTLTFIVSFFFLFACNKKKEPVITADNPYPWEENPTAPSPPRHDYFDDNGMVVDTTSSSPFYSHEVDTVKAKALVKNFTVKYDEFAKYNLTWYTPKSAPKTLLQNSVYCYFGTQKGIGSILRMKVQYAGDDWLFFNKVVFSADGEVVELIPQKVNKDNKGTQIFEWSDDLIYPQQYAFLENAKTVKVKLIGSEYSKIYNITPAELTAIKETLALYKAKGGF